MKLKNIHNWFFEENVTFFEALPYYGLLSIGFVVLGVMSLVVS